MFFDDTSPRRPKFPFVPTPFNQEKPQLTVPDVSLIFNSPSASEVNSSLPFNQNKRLASASNFLTPVSNASSTNMTTPMSKPTTSISMSKIVDNSSTEPTMTFKLIKHLFELTRSQGKIIDRMDKQIRELTAKEETHFAELLAAINNNNSSRNPNTKCDSAIQTDNCESTQRTHENVQPCPASTKESPNTSDSVKQIKMKRTRKSKSASPPKSDLKTKECDYVEARKENRIDIPITTTNVPEKTEDLSTILRDLELPSIKEQSLYSSADNSVGQFDLHDYKNDSILNSPHVGPSISEYEISSTDDDDEDEGNIPKVQPSTTFYRNVLGNVNRILEGDSNQGAEPQESNLFQPVPTDSANNSPRHLNSNANSPSTPKFTRSTTDTTLYGFPSNYLSFATKNYLQRHGLINTGSPNRRTNSNGNQFQDSGSGSDSSTNGRILDVSALKNQPKLI